MKYEVRAHEKQFESLLERIARNYDKLAEQLTELEAKLPQRDDSSPRSSPAPNKPR